MGEVIRFDLKLFVAVSAYERSPGFPDPKPAEERTHVVVVNALTRLLRASGVHENQATVSCPGQIARLLFAPRVPILIGCEHERGTHAAFGDLSEQLFLIAGVHDESWCRAGWTAFVGRRKNSTLGRRTVESRWGQVPQAPHAPQAGAAPASGGGSTGLHGAGPANTACVPAVPRGRRRSRPSTNARAERQRGRQRPSATGPACQPKSPTAGRWPGGTSPRRPSGSSLLRSTAAFIVCIASLVELRR